MESQGHMDIERERVEALARTLMQREPDLPLERALIRATRELVDIDRRLMHKGTITVEGEKGVLRWGASPTTYRVTPT